MFECQTDSECAGPTDGQCEAQGYCSFPDAECESGRRFGSLAGGGVADECVPPAMETTDTTATSVGSAATTATTATTTIATTGGESTTPTSGAAGTTSTAGSTVTSGPAPLPGLLAIDEASNSLYRIDPDAPSIEMLCTFRADVDFGALAFLADGTLIGNDGVRTFFVDPCACTFEPALNLPDSGFGSLAVAPDGTAYTIGNVTDELFVLDFDTNSVDLVGPLNTNIGNQGATWFPPVGSIVALDATADRLLEVNPATGSATELLDFGADFLFAGLEVGPDGESLYVCSNLGFHQLTLDGPPQLVFDPELETCSNLALEPGPLEC